VDLLKNHTFLHHNLEYGIPFYDESVDFVYSSHLLEHLFRDDAEKLVQEMFRVLKKGGRARMCLPDLEFAVACYGEGKKEFLLDNFPISRKAGCRYSHKYAYDFEMLKSLFLKAGVSKVERYSFDDEAVSDTRQLAKSPWEGLIFDAVK
jgi:predicted SAM-dependent methyltransferase